MGQRANPMTLWLGILLLALPTTMGAATATETGRPGAYGLAGAEFGSAVLVLLVLAVAVAVATAGAVAVHKLSSS